MRHLKKYVERVSQEDSANTDVDITQKDPVIAQVDASEPDEVKELNPDAIVEPDPEHVAEQIKEYTDIKTSLEQYSGLLKEAKTRGGLRAEEGAILAVGVQHFRNRLGMEVFKVSQEDFGGTMSRDAATDLSQDSIDEMVEVADERIAELQPEEGGENV